MPDTLTKANMVKYLTFWVCLTKTLLNTYLSGALHNYLVYVDYIKSLGNNKKNLMKIVFVVWKWRDERDFEWLQETKKWKKKRNWQFSLAERKNIFNLKRFSLERLGWRWQLTLRDTEIALWVKYYFYQIDTDGMIHSQTVFKRTVSNSTVIYDQLVLNDSLTMINALFKTFLHGIY